MSRSRALTVAALLLGLVAAGFFGVLAHRAAATAEARSDALAAAEKRVPELLS